MNELEKFIIARWTYSIGVQWISNEEYTVLLNYCKEKYPDNEYVNRSWSSDPCPTELLKKYGLEEYIKAVILSDKTESIESLNNWAMLKKELGDWEGFGTLSMKHDGWNMQASYYRGHLIDVQSRGRSGDSFNASILGKLIPQTIPVEDKVKVVMECTVPYNNFSRCVQMWNSKEPRNAVSTILAHPEFVDMLELHAVDIHGYQTLNKFDTLEQWGFNVPEYRLITNYPALIDALDELSNESVTYNSPTDGAVIDAGFKFAIRLLAWEEPICYSYVLGYENSYDRYVITPKVIIYPYLRGGTLQKRLAVTNWQRIMNLNLKPGAPVAFRVASGANADLNEEATRLIQDQYKDRLEEYQLMIRQNETEKQTARKQRYISD